MNLFCSPLDLHYLCNVLFPERPFSRLGIKRETGENPVQSRCCKLHKDCSIQSVATASGRREGDWNGVSQKTCKAN